jgi:hypothetical protein
MVAIYYVGGHESVEDAGHNLDAKKAADEASHHNQTSSLVGPAIIFEIAF